LPEAGGLSSALEVKATGEQVSTPGFQSNGWYEATVPGTVLTTLIDRGVYPDPDYGLNNLAIPETLNKHDYWYRTEFTPSAIGYRSQADAYISRHQLFGNRLAEWQAHRQH
jgi:hypothetical protein